MTLKYFNENKGGSGVKFFEVQTSDYSVPVDILVNSSDTESVLYLGLINGTEQTIAVFSGYYFNDTQEQTDIYVSFTCNLVRNGQVKSCILKYAFKGDETSNIIPTIVEIG